MRGLVLSAVALGLVACAGEEPPRATAEGDVTWADDVAGIVHGHCAECHRPGQPAPFSLLTYEDVFRKRRQVARVTASGYMPPWLPTHGDFVGARGLTPGELEVLQRWEETGAARGDDARAPEAPVFTEGWQLGRPDLVVTALEEVQVPADGPDLFVNLVLPFEGDTLRFVEAVVIRPGGASVHHAVLQVDGTRDARVRAAADPGPGFQGMSMGLSTPPDGHFLGWTPGKRAHREPPGRAWRLWPGSDLVLQLHLTPTGRPERVQPRVGLYLTEEPPAEFPMALVMRSEEIDIGAGVTDFRATDAITLPVAAELRALYPHAHHLATIMEVRATPPGGAAEVLLRIDDWDFDWQDDYRLAAPRPLAAGTRLEFEYRYDNSADNPDNPSSPPRRVRYGLRSEDEMATLSLTLVASRPEDRGRLVEAMARRDVERSPGDARAWVNLAVATREAADPAAGPAWRSALEAAAGAAQRALTLDPARADALREQGICLMALGAAGPAEEVLRQALRMDPGESIARMHLGELLARSGRARAAIVEFEAALEVHAHHAPLRNNLATALFAEGELGRAVVQYRAAVRLRPEYFNAWFNLGRALHGLGDAAGARAALNRAAALRPGDPAVRQALGDLRGD